MSTWNPVYANCYPTVALRNVNQGGELSISHVKSRLIKLDDAAGTIIQSRDRVFSLDVTEDITRTSPRVPAESVTTPAAVESDSIANPLHGTISEDFTAADNSIVFMDVRNDLVVTKRNEHKVSFSDDTTATVRTDLWSPFTPILGATWVDFRFDVAEQIVSGDFIDEEQIHTGTSTATHALALATGVFGTQSGVVPLGTDVWIVVVWTDDGGIDYYRPEWLALIGTDRFMDLTDRDVYLNSFWWGAHSGTTDVTDIHISEQGQPIGAWAVDLGGNRFYSQLVAGGTYSKLTTLDGSVEDVPTVTGITGSNEKFYPIAPL